LTRLVTLKLVDTEAQGVDAGPGVGGEELAVPGDGRARPAAFEKLRADDFLELRDGFRHGRLRKRKAVGGALNRAELQHREEALHVAELDPFAEGIIHNQSLWINA
jgi:hypothetical protein